jgi:hypothetical protein
MDHRSAIRLIEEIELRLTFLGVDLDATVTDAGAREAGARIAGGRTGRRDRRARRRSVSSDRTDAVLTRS